MSSLRVRLALTAVVAGLLLPASAAPAALRSGELERELGPGVTVEKQAETGKVRFVGTEPGRPIAPPVDGSRRAVALGFAESLAAELGIAGPSDRLAVSEVDRLDDGRSAVRLQQLERDVPVIGGEIVVNLDADREVLSLSGEASPRPRLDLEPRISRAAADDIALAAFSKQSGVAVEELAAARPELQILDSRIMGGPGLEQPTLVWQTELTPADPDSLEPIRQFVAVDALLGVVALSFSQIADAKDRVVCDADSTATKYPCSAPFERTEASGPSAETDVNNAFDFAGDTYDLFFDKFGRDSLDGGGMQLVQTVRYCPSGGGCPYANAFWDGSQMVYGEGFSAADDVVGHELAHGVTDFSSSLFYYYQSGAINESMSDIFGEFVDLRNDSGPDTRWLLGEDLPSIFNVCGADPHIIRNMADPPDCGDPDRMQSGLYWSAADDNGGVHINSGVNNKAAFLLTDGASFNGQTVAGLGIDKVARLYYEVNNNLLTSASDYQDLGSALRQACVNLTGTHGIAAGDCAEVDRAVLATEMDEVPVAAPASDAPACPGAGEVPTDLFFDDLETPGSGNWALSTQVGTKAWFYPQNPNGIIDATYATSGETNFWAYNRPTTSDSAIAMISAVAIPAGAYLHFRHAYDFEESGGVRWDGGVVEYSTDGGSSWVDAGALIDANGYPGMLSAANPLGARQAFSGASQGYIASRADLSSLQGESVRFRFRVGTDSAVDDYGWFIDDVRIHTCGPTDTTAPDTRIDSGPEAGTTIAEGSATFGFSSPDDPSASFQCSLDGAPFGACTGAATHALSGLPDGAHSFAVRARDPAGNVDPSPASRSFTVQRPRPAETRIDSGPADGSVLKVDSAIFGFSSPDDPSASFQCSLDGAPFGACTGVGRHRLGALRDGNHSFAVRAVNPAGPDPTPASRTVEVVAEACGAAKRALESAKSDQRRAKAKAMRLRQRAKRADGRRAARLWRKAKRARRDARSARRDTQRARAGKRQACRGN